jgi:hypothetical protein
MTAGEIVNCILQIVDCRFKIDPVLIYIIIWSALGINVQNCDRLFGFTSNYPDVE